MLYRLSVMRCSYRTRPCLSANEDFCRACREPKSDPRNRQRSAIACQSCKRSKIRCDSGKPCTACSKKGFGDSCTYGTTQGINHGCCPSRAMTHNNRKNHTQRKSLSESIHPTPETFEEDGCSANVEDQGPKSRMLLSSKFQKGVSRQNLSLMPEV